METPARYTVAPLTVPTEPSAEQPTEPLRPLNFDGPVIVEIGQNRFVNLDLIAETDVFDNAPQGLVLITPGARGDALIEVRGEARRLILAYFAYRARRTRAILLSLPEA